MRHPEKFVLHLNDPCLHFKVVGTVFGLCFKYMTAILLTPMLGAIGFSLIYLLLGGGLGGALLLFIIAKMLGR